MIEYDIRYGAQAEEALAQLTLRAMLKRKLYRVQQVLLCVLAALLFVLAAMKLRDAGELAYQLLGSSGSLRATAVLYAVLGAACAFMAFAGMRMLFRFLCRKAVRSANGKTEALVRHIRIADDGISIRTAASDSTVDWSLVSEWGEIGAYLYLRLSDQSVILAGNGTPPEAGVAALRARLRSQGVPEAAK